MAQSRLSKPAIGVNPVPAISVIICTYNRADRLLLALEALTQQTLPSSAFEVLVVDNRSTDNTPAICRVFQERFANFRYVYEPIQGLSKARNTGWQLSQSLYIAYLDDDAIPCKEWVEAILNVFETVRPKPASIGGPIYPLGRFRDLTGLLLTWKHCLQCWMAAILLAGLTKTSTRGEQM